MLGWDHGRVEHYVFSLVVTRLNPLIDSGQAAEVLETSVR